MWEEFRDQQADIRSYRESYKNKYINNLDMTLGDYQGLLQDVPITFDVYQEQTQWSSAYPYGVPVIFYCALGLAGETGELCEKVKKLFRNDNGVMTDEAKAGITKEAGDVLWYLSALCYHAGISLEEVAKQNQLKLVDRLKRNVVRSTGDDR